MVTTEGAGRGGKLWDRESRSCAASVSSALRVRKTVPSASPPADMTDSFFVWFRDVEPSKAPLGINSCE